jgi:hypothetical protein
MIVIPAASHGAFLADCRSLAPSALAGPAASQPVSASCYRRTEDVGVLPVVVAPLELGDVERQILAADVVERANDP